MYRVKVHQVDAPVFALAEFAHGPAPTGNVHVSLRRQRDEEHLLVETNTMEYEGTSLQEGSKYLLAVARKQAKTLEVLDSDAGSLFVLEERIKGYQPQLAEEKTVVTISDLSGHRQKKKYAANAQFSMAGKEMAVQEQTAKLLDEVQPQAPAAQTALIPPHNLETTHPKEIYSLPAMLSDGLRDALLSEVVLGMETMLRSREELEQFLKSNSVPDQMREWLSLVLLDLCDGNVSKPEMRTRAMGTAFVLLAACYLQEFFPDPKAPGGAANKHGSMGTKLFNSEWKIKLAGKMSKQFADKANGVYKLSDRKRIMVLNYAAVAMLHSHAVAQLNLRHFCSVFGILDTVARKVCTVIGCTSKTKPSSRKEKEGEEAAATATLEPVDEIWTLKAPLKLPVMVMRQKKKK